VCACACVCVRVCVCARVCGKRGEMPFHFIVETRNDGRVRAIPDLHFLLGF